MTPSVSELTAQSSIAFWDRCGSCTIGGCWVILFPGSNELFRPLRPVSFPHQGPVCPRARKRLLSNMYQRSGLSISDVPEVGCHLGCARQLPVQNLGYRQPTEKFGVAQRDPRVSGAIPVMAVPAPGFALHSPVSGHATAVQMRLVPHRHWWDRPKKQKKKNVH